MPVAHLRLRRSGRRYSNLGLRCGALAAMLAISACTSLSPETARPPTAVESAALRWLDLYEESWNDADVHRLARFLGRDAAGRIALQRYIEEHPRLRVELTDVRVQETQPGVVRALYVRRDSWADPESGQVRTSSGAYQHWLRVHDGHLIHVEVSRR